MKSSKRVLSQCYSKALSHAFQDSSGTGATECRLEKIKRWDQRGEVKGGRQPSEREK